MAIGGKTKTGAKRVAGMYIMNTAKGAFFFADCSVNL